MKAGARRGPDCLTGRRPMVLSDVSIKRPVFATVLSLLLVVIGVAAFQRLPVREYPDIDPPVVSVTTEYDGAAANVVENQITQIVEDAIAGIEGIKTITSQSRDERSQVTIEFRLGRDVDSAANDVRDRVARSVNLLPDTADAPQIAKVDADARPILWVMMVSESHTQMELTEIANDLLVDRLSVVDGVSQVRINGERKPSMRIWLDRRALAARNLTVDDVEQAIRRQSIELPGGRLESSTREFSVRTDTRLATPAEFRSVVVKSTDGVQTLLGEVATVERAPETERGDLRIGGRQAVGLGILRNSKANTLSVADGVRAEVDRIRPGLPEGIRLVYGYDESLFIAQSIYEVFHALAIALALVVGVIFLFLRSVVATIIPAVAIPVSIIASFAAMAAMGFSLNVLTLLGLVLAIGLVVDDAIIVLENIHRRIEEGEPPLLAAIRGARQIAFAVIATTVVLVSVFVPISFMEGNTGRLFTEFGFGLAASVLFSGLVALTLTPMMCSRLLKAHEADGWLIRNTEPAFVGLNNGFRWLVVRAMRLQVFVLTAVVLLSGLAAVLFTVIPKELAPTEDRGTVIVPVTAPEGSTFAYTGEQVARIEQIFAPYIQSGEVETVFAAVGGFAPPAQPTSANVIARLTPWGERHKTQQQIASEVFPQLSRISGVRAFALNPPSMGQRGFQPPVQFVIGGPDYETLAQWRDLFLARARENPRLLNLDSNLRETKPELRIQIDRRRAADLGISIESIGRTVETMLGSREVGKFLEGGDEYRVLMQAVAGDRITSSDISNIFVRGRDNALIPLSNLVSFEERARPQSLNREDRQRSVTITATPADNYSLGEALEYMEAVAREVLPAEARIAYRGVSLEFKESGSALYVTFALAILVVFLVLAAQFESWVHPLIVLVTAPLAVTGGLLALWITGLTLNIFSQIGMILLIGLMAKNGILVVEFANQLRDEGRSVRDAVIEASVTRLRPILMTTIATILGAVPLATAHGAGGESRMAVGVVIIGGMTLSTFVTLFAIPVIYNALAGLTGSVNATARRIDDLEDAERKGGGHHPAPVPAE